MSKDLLPVALQQGPLSSHKETLTSHKPRRAHGSCAEAPGPLSGSFASLDWSNGAMKCLNQAHCPFQALIKLRCVVTYGQTQNPLFYKGKA